MTPAVTPDPELVRMYRESEQWYLQSLPLEHFMEATAQATQRTITLESFAVIAEARPEVQVFNELLVQYPRPGVRRPGQVVPDNMVVVHPDPIVADGSFNTPLQPVGPVLVMEYVSKHTMRKDYEGNMLKYEQSLKVPYYLLFYPDNDELTVFRLAGDRYATTTPNAAGRLPIPELELEAALLDGWVRFWFRGELVPLPGELVRRIAAMEDQLAATQEARAAAVREAAAERQARAAAERQAEVERQARLGLEAEVARLREELARRP